MLLLVERARVEESADGAPSGDEKCHTLAESKCKDG